MKVHLFEAKSYPSCAFFCLRETAREFGKFFHPQTAEIVFKNFHVDDCLLSVTGVESAIQVVKDLRSLLSRGGFRLTKWLSSNEEVMRTIPDEDKFKSIKNVMPSSSLRERVLGVHWHVPTDQFFCKVVVPDVLANKREMLSVTNSLYDPLGFVLPVILRARLLLSKVCKDKQVGITTCRGPLEKLRVMD